MYVNRARGNVKKGCDVELWPFTLIVGGNGAGKTTIIETVTLATEGFVPELRGRANVKRTTDLIELTSDPKELRAEVTFSDGLTSSWRANRTPKGAGHAKTVRARPVVFPTLETTDQLLKSVEELRRWLLGQVGVNLPEDRVLASFTSGGQAAWHRLVRNLPAVGLIDRLSHVLKAAKTRRLWLRDKIKTAAENLDRALTEGSVTAIDLAPIQARIAATQEALREAQRHHLTRTARARLPQARAEVEQLNGKLRDALGGVDPAARDRVQHVADMLVQSLSAGICHVCGQPASLDHEATKNHATKLGSFLQIKAQDPVRVRMLEAQLRQATQTVAQLESLPESPEGADVTALEAQIIAQSRELEAASQQNNRRLKALADRDDANGWQVELQEVEDLIGDCRRVLRIVLDNGIKSFESRVQGFLPPSDRFAVVVTERIRTSRTEIDPEDLEDEDFEDRGVCRIGFRTEDGALRTVLSGAEWARMILALAFATLDSPDLAVLLPPDRAWDSVSLADAMRELAKPTTGKRVQVILTTTVWPASIPPLWHVIDLGGASGQDPREKK